MPRPQSSLARLIVEILERRDLMNADPVLTAFSDGPILTHKNTPVLIDVLANDQNPNGGDLQIIQVVPFGNAVATLTEDHRVLVTPETDFVGDLMFAYVITNGTETSAATATVQVRRTPEELLDAYEQAVEDADLAYILALDGADEERDLIEDLAEGEYYGDADELYAVYESTVADAESAYQTAHAAADAVYQDAIAQAQTALDARNEDAETDYYVALSLAEDTWNQAMQDAASAHDAAVLAAESAYLDALAPLQANVVAAQTYADEHPEDPDAQSALAQAQQSLADAELQAQATRDAAFVDAIAARQAAEAQADLDYEADSDAALAALNTELDAAQQEFEQAGLLAWEAYQPLEDAALAARTQAEQAAWTAYQTALAQALSERAADDSAAAALWSGAQSGAAIVRRQAEQAAWTTYSDAMFWHGGADPSMRRPTLPGWTDEEPFDETPPEESEPPTGELPEEEWGSSDYSYDWPDDTRPEDEDLYTSAPVEPETTTTSTTTQGTWWLESSPYFARNLEQAKYRAWNMQASSTSGATAIGQEIADAFAVSAQLTWNEFFPLAEYDRARTARINEAQALDPALLAALDADWKAYCPPSTDTTGIRTPIGEFVASRWSRVPGFDWVRAGTSWHELYTRQAYDRLRQLRDVPISKITMQGIPTPPGTPRYDGWGFGQSSDWMLFVRFTSYLSSLNTNIPDDAQTGEANRAFLTNQVRDVLVPRLRYATLPEVTGLLGSLTRLERVTLRLALDLEMARATEQLNNTGTDEATKRRAQESLTICQNLYSEMHYAGDAAKYGMHGAQQLTFETALGWFQHAADGSQPELGRTNYRGTIEQRVAFLADTSYEAYLARERAAIDMAHGPSVSTERTAALNALPSAFQYYLTRSMLLYSATRHPSSGGLSYQYAGYHWFQQPQGTFRQAFGATAAALHECYFRGVLDPAVSAQGPLSEADFWAKDRFALETMALPLVSGWKDATQPDRQFFADTLHPMERTALLNSLVMAEKTYLRSGNNTLATAAKAMREFLSDEFNRQMRLLETNGNLRDFYNYARLHQRALGGVNPEVLSQMRQLAPQVMRLADAEMTEAFRRWRAENPFRVTYQPAWGWEFVDRAVLNTAEFLSPVMRTGQRLAGRTTDEWGDLDAMREIMRGNYNVTLGPSALNTGFWATLGDSLLTVATVTPIGGVMTPTRHLIVMTGSVLAASTAMAAVEIAPISEQWRAPLRFAAGLAAGIRGGSVANNAMTMARTRMPLLAARTIDMMRVQAALVEDQMLMATYRVAGVPITTEMIRSQIWLTTELSAVRNHIGRLRSLYTSQSLENLENAYRDAMNDLAAWESRAAAPGLSPSQRAALRNNTDFQRARTVANEATRQLEQAYVAIDNTAPTLDVVMDLMRGGSSSGAP